MRSSVALFVVALIPTGSAVAQVPAAERDALIALYNGTDGANWSNKTGWLGAAGTECSWWGVTCAGGHVERLSLSSNNLNGALPQELGNLSSLVGLQLWSNQLSGSIPQQLGSLSSLVDLGLEWNQLGGSIPSQLGSLPSLETLNLSSNQLDGVIPSELGDLSSLLELYLDSNQLSGSIPSQLDGLSNVLYMDLSDNQLDGSIPPELGDMSSLQELDLSFNQLSGAIPPELADSPNLIKLNLSSNQLDGSIPPGFGNASALDILDLSSNQLSGVIPSSFGSSSSLSELYLSSNQLSGAIPPELSGMSNLRSLDLGSNRLGGAIPPELGSIWTLRNLDLSSNRLSGSIPPQLGDLSNLRELDLSSNRLSGSIPGDLEDLSALYADSSDLRWNALHSANASLVTFLNGKQMGGDWLSTQTIAPVNLTVDSVGDHTVWLSWDAVSYQADPGGYSVYSAPTGSGVWTLRGQAEAKTTLTWPVTGLDPGTSYDLAVASYTDTHANNLNLVEGDLGSSEMATTADTSCAQPIIEIAWGDQITLSVPGSYDSYLWNTGATTSAIDIDPLVEHWYWVTVTSAGPCEETAAVATPVFLDGFESGDTTRWSASVP
jgi:Leucine-rich repeat (LRR) protein